MAPTIGLKLPKDSGSPMWPYDVSAGEWAARAEAMGYDSVWTSESWGSDAFVDLAAAATRTDEIRLATAIANVFSRSPAVLAMAGATLARLSNDRFLLGLGVSHPGIVEAIHDMPYDQPVTRGREVLELVAALTRGPDAVEYTGELFEVAGVPPLETRVPLFNAALGPRNRRITGEVADGWLPYLLPVSTLEDRFEAVREGAVMADRDPDEIEVTPQILAAVDADPDVARRPIREYVARYIGNYDAYKNAIAEVFPDEAAAVAAAWREGEKEDAVRRVSDEMVAEFGVAGPPDAAREQLRDILAVDIVDCPIVYVPNGVQAEMLETTITELSPTNV